MSLFIQLTTEKLSSILPKVVCCKRTALVCLGEVVVVLSSSASEAWAALPEFNVMGTSCMQLGGNF